MMTQSNLLFGWKYEHSKLKFAKSMQIIYPISAYFISDITFPEEIFYMLGRQY